MRVLRDVFGQRTITPEQAEQVTEQRIVMPLHEEMEGGGITTIERFEELVIAEMIQARPHSRRLALSSVHGAMTSGYPSGFATER